jgi:hypothetical protein
MRGSNLGTLVRRVNGASFLIAAGSPTAADRCRLVVALGLIALAVTSGAVRSCEARRAAGGAAMVSRRRDREQRVLRRANCDALHRIALPGGYIRTATYKPIKDF